MKRTFVVGGTSEWVANMYEEWPSIEDEILDDSRCRSVLHDYPLDVGRDVAKSVVSSLIAASGW